MRDTPELTITLDPVNQLKRSTLKENDFAEDLDFEPSLLHLQKNKSVMPAFVSSFSPLRFNQKPKLGHELSPSVIA